MRRSRQRYAGWVDSSRRGGTADDAAPGNVLDAVYCPHGHHIARQRLVDAGESLVLQCGHVEAPGHAHVCRAYLLVVTVLRPVALDCGELMRRLYVAELDEREERYLRSAREGADVYETLAWLGCVYAPPSAAVSRTRPTRSGVR